MTRSLKIAGIERHGDLQEKTLVITQALTYEMDSSTFYVKGDKPTEEEEVIVDDTTRRFGGIIKKVSIGKIEADRSIVWKVDCDDYTSLLDDKLVVERYQGWTGDAIFIDIAEKYCPGFTTTGVKTGAAVIEDTGDNFYYKRPSECFKWLCKYLGWHWQPTYYKDLQFFSAEDLITPAPMSITEANAGKFAFGNHTADTQDMANRVYVLGGTMLSDYQPVSWKADGAARQWTLPWGPHEIKFEEAAGYIGVGGAAKKIGVEYLTEDETTVDYLLNYQEKYIRAATQTELLDEGTILSFEAKQGLPVITMAEDVDSQMALVVIQGGDGIKEHFIYDEKLVTVEAAEAAGYAYLRENANPRVNGYVETEEEGWHPGQILPISQPKKGIVGTYLVQRVISRTISPTKWLHKIEYGGRLLGIADFLKALISTQQYKVEDAAIVNKFIYGAETVTAEDDAVFTERVPPWYCGDPDAICGFIECVVPSPAGGMGYIDIWLILAERGNPSITDANVPWYTGLLLPPTDMLTYFDPWLTLYQWGLPSITNEEESTWQWSS